MSHYFHTPDEGATRPIPYEFDFAERHLTIVSESGIFSRGALDKATAHLLRYLDEHRHDIAADLPEGDLVDLGCGAGPIAIAMAIAFPERIVWAVDVNERAVELTRLNAQSLALGNIRAVGPDDPRLPRDFAMLWSNPPIRIGKDELHALLIAWLGRLRESGCAYMVVSKNLGGDSLQRWLIDNGFPTNRMGSKSGFRIFRCGARTT